MAFDSRPRLARIGCSTLVLTGSIDSAVAMNHARMLHDGIPGARLVVVDGTGHALIWTARSSSVRSAATSRSTGAHEPRPGRNGSQRMDAPPAGGVGRGGGTTGGGVAAEWVLLSIGI